MALRSLKSWLMPVISQLFLSRARLLKRRVSAEKKRVAQGRPHTLHFFHQIDDPYSQLLDCVLSQLQSRFDVCIERHITSPPEDSAVPERELLNAYSQTDAQRLADHFNIDWTFKPIDAQALTAQPQASAVANALRKKWGHYLGATLYYEGEWYWGIDRLHHLEDRLNTLGLSKSTYQGPLFPTIQYQDFANAPEGTSIDFFFSLRSPYSAISVAKVFHWARQSGIEVNLRYVLPMAMRGLPVPAEKRRYISLDAAREAFVQGVPFGCVNDPLGTPTERGLALMPFAEMHNAAEAYVMSFMQGVWAEGLDAGTDKHLKIMVERAGLNWTAAKDILKSKSNDTHWRAIAEQNRQALFSLGLWGVPSFKFENTAAWGQDRFWVIEKALHDKFNSAQTASSAST
jgi:2-hydroxychromene-2-carboxylate isomerase